MSRGEPKRGYHTLDVFTLADIKAGKEFEARIKEFYTRHYSELAQQRVEIFDDLRTSLLIAAMEGREFQKWQRAMPYRYSNRPLSMAGSLKAPGGRFNIAALEELLYSPFPSLYLAEDKETAISELLGQDAHAGTGDVTIYEHALTKPTSISVVSLTCHVETLIDLGKPERLNGFVSLIREFRLSVELQKLGRELAKAMKVEPANLLKLIRNTSKLLAAVLAPNWRELPVQLGIRSSPQIFGQLVCQSGIEGVLYPSKLTGHSCLAVFPKAFAGSSSHVSLDEEPPRKDVVRRLDRDNWQALCK